MTFEELIKKTMRVNDTEFIPDFRISVQNSEQIINDRTVHPHIIVHPLNHNGETLDFVVVKNKLRKWEQDDQGLELKRG